MFAAPGFRTGSGLVVGSYIGSDGRSADVSTDTFALVPSGRTQVRRYVVAMGWASGIDRTLDSATIGGVAATIRRQRLAGGGTRVAVFDALVLTSGGNDVVFTLSGVMSSGLSWLSLYDVGDAEYRVDEQDVDTDTLSIAQAAYKGEFAIGIVHAYRLLGAGTWSWTAPLVEDSEQLLSGNRISAASYVIAADGTLTAAATNTNSNDCCGIAAIYMPPG